MTERTNINDNGKGDLLGNESVGIDPRLVELVRFMARCAAENDFESLLEAAKNKEEILSGEKDIT